MSNYLIVNFDRKEYLRPEMFGEHADLKSVLESYDGVLTALAVLLSDGNNRGGGDLRSNHLIIGTWAGCRIAMVDELVTDAALSEPGMQHLPLQQQVLSLGQDISKAAIDAILEGEGDYSILSKLNPLLTIPLVQQRDLGESALSILGTAAGRKKPLQSLHDFFAVLGVSSAWSPYMAKKRLEQGLLKTAETFLRPERYAVTDFDWVQAPTLQVTEVRFVLTNTTTLESKALTFKFGESGHSAEAVLGEFFAGLTFEKKPTLSNSVSSPEVAKLLSMIPNLET